LDDEISETLAGYQDFLQLDAVQQEIAAAKDDAHCSPRYIKGVLAAIIAESGPVGYSAIADRLNISDTSNVSKAASELERRRIVTKDKHEGEMTVDLNVDGIEAVRRAAAEREKTEQLMNEL
jgi:DNA-binding transcriptional regulator GbsR (MarR family)